jgi:hypothetical protein
LAGLVPHHSVQKRGSPTIKSNLQGMNSPLRLRQKRFNSAVSQRLAGRTICDSTVKNSKNKTLDLI